MIKSIYLLPHGGIIVPGMEKHRNGAAERLHQAMLSVAEDMEKDKIQLIFLTSPHGYVHAKDYLVYFHNVFEGFHIYQDRGEKIEVDQFLWPGNTQVAEILFQIMAKEDIPVSPIILADPNYNFKLAWGETIPLSYIADQSGPQVVIFSLPIMVKDNTENKRNLQKIGSIINGICESQTFQDIAVSVVISGDLSHRHDANHEYGFSEDAKPFDNKSIKWAENPSAEAFDDLLQLHETAASCGIYGMGIIQGVIDSSEGKWENKALTYEVPSYFGMMVSSWKPMIEEKK